MDERLSDANTSVLQRRITYLKSTKNEQSYNDILRSKYTPINKVEKKKKNQKQESTTPNGTQTNNGVKSAQTKDPVGLDYLYSITDKPRVNLYERDQIDHLLKWKEIKPIGCGLNNLGNTCFLNSALQCLTYTPPLANIMLNKYHSSKCGIKNFCMFCVLEKHICATQRSSRVITPGQIVQNLSQIGKQFRKYRQEDSHEFLRMVIDHLQQNCLSASNLPAGVTSASLKKSEQFTTIIHAIFGGILQSQVKCQKCNHESDTFDRFLDLSLEMKRCRSLEEAFAMFCRPEKLDIRNQYRCEKCKQLSQAIKQFTIFQAPNVLTIHLKRFDEHGRKIDNPIVFNPTLKLNDYMSRRSMKRFQSFEYSLYAVLVHVGHSSNSGHYYCFVKSAAEQWYEMNDETVRQVSQAVVLKQRAYILFYVRKPTNQIAPKSNDTNKASASVQSSPKAVNTNTTKSAPNSPKTVAPASSKSAPNSPRVISPIETGKQSKKRKRAESIGKTEEPDTKRQKTDPFADLKIIKAGQNKKIKDDNNKETSISNSNNKNNKNNNSNNSNNIIIKKEESTTTSTFSDSKVTVLQNKGVVKEESSTSTTNTTTTKVVVRKWDDKVEKKATAPPTKNKTLERLLKPQKKANQLFDEVWEDVDANQIAKERKPVIQQLTEELKSSIPEARDSYDLEYDKGKVKKVRKPKPSIGSAPNRFQLKSDYARQHLKNKGKLARGKKRRYNSNKNDEKKRYFGS